MSAPLTRVRKIGKSKQAQNMDTFPQTLENNVQTWLAIHIPRFKVTCNLQWIESWTYMSLASSDLHLPCTLNRQSGIPLLAAAVAPPALKLWVP